MIQKTVRPLTRNGEHLRDLLLALTQKEIKIRYKSSWLGYVWSLANPLAFMLLYFIVFGVFMRTQAPGYPYPLFLIAGLFPWQWFANSVNAAPNIFLGNSSLIKKVRFPRNLLVMSTVLHDGTHFVLSIPIILGGLLMYRHSPSWSWLLGIPLLIPAQVLMVYGLALTIASVNLFFRDLERLTVLLTTFLFFLTPVVYPLATVPAPYHVLIYLNPAVPLILSWQQLFLAGHLPWPLIVAAYGHALVSLGCGTFVFQKLSWKFAEVV
jgi:lipopolysaccharide transport system permease protein